MSERVNFVRRITAVMILGLLVVPLIASSASLEEDDRKESEQELNWWENTNMDTNKDRIHDAIWMAPESSHYDCLLYTSPSPRDLSTSRMPSSA